MGMVSTTVLSRRKKKHVLLGLSFFGTLQPYNEGDIEVELLGGLDDTLSNVIAPHDACVKGMRVHAS